MREQRREGLFNHLTNSNRWLYTSKRAVQLGKMWPARCVCAYACMSVTKANVTQVLFQSHCIPLPSLDSNQVGRTVNSTSGLNNRHQSRRNAMRRKPLHTSMPPSFLILPTKPKPISPSLSLHRLSCVVFYSSLALLQHLPSLPSCFFLFTYLSLSHFHSLTLKKQSLK